MKRSKSVIGLTGTIASGKSTTARYFAERYGIPVIDADKVGHAILRDPAVKKQITAAFGEAVCDDTGEIVRGRLGAIVFADEEKLQQLNGITHPAICAKIRHWISEQQQTEAPFIIVEAIELLRSELVRMVEQVWVVCADPRVRMERMTAERKMSAEQAADRIASQWDDEEYKSRAHRVIDGGGSVAMLERCCDRIYQEMLSAAGKDREHA